MSDSANLDQGQLCWLPLQRGETVLCLAGSLWLSHAGQDIILQAGDEYQASQPQLLLCQALQAARLLRRQQTPQPALVAQRKSRPSILHFWRAHT